MLTVGRFIPEKFGWREKLPMMNADWLGEEISSAWDGSQQEHVWLCIFAPL
jgi:hypothetical protein